MKTLVFAVVVMACSFATAAPPYGPPINDRMVQVESQVAELMDRMASIEKKLAVMESRRETQSKSAENGTEVMFFKTDNCRPCEEMQARLAGYSVTTINASDDPATAAKYGIEEFPALVLVRDGKWRARTTGVVPPEVVNSWLAQPPESNAVSNVTTTRTAIPVYRDTRVRSGFVGNVRYHRYSEPVYSTPVIRSNCPTCVR